MQKRDQDNRRKRISKSGPAKKENSPTGKRENKSKPDRPAEEKGNHKTGTRKSTSDSLGRTERKYSENPRSSFKKKYDPNRPERNLSDSTDAKPRYDDKRGEGRDDRESSFKRRTDTKRVGKFKSNSDESSSRPDRRNSDNQRSSFKNKYNPSKPDRDLPDSADSKPRYDEKKSESRDNKESSFKRRTDTKRVGGFKSNSGESSSRSDRKYSDNPRSTFKKKYNPKTSERRFDNDGDSKPKYEDRKEENNSSYKRTDRIKKSDSYKNSKKKQSGSTSISKNAASGKMRLNKFIANAGICSRREADDYIRAGVVMVNGAVVTEMGILVDRTDEVKFNNEKIRSEKKVYLLLNKPKNYVSTVSDSHAEKTVMDLIKGACPERVYPVGRLDKNTTGLLLFTNDGDLAKRLTHPKYKKKKIYQVTTDKNVIKSHLVDIASGIELEDGFIQADSISYADPVDKKIIGIEIHSGKNRVVRRIFEHFNYKVVKLDRVYFAGLTKKNLPRGEYRFLTPKEIGMLSMNAFA